MASLALAFDILAKDRASKTFRDVGDAADGAGRKGRGFGTSMKGAMGLAAGAVAAAGLGSMFTGFIKDAAESARIGRLTAAVVKSTGGAAKITAAQVGDLATAISNKTAVDDEAIQSGANLLLTFTKVRNEAGKGNDIFNQATQAAVDMSAAMGTDLQGATLQLGKALNDPIKGVTALGRAGVQFTQQQKDQIKTLVESGDTLGAQKIILKEMQTQFGGAAAAAADPLARLQVIAGNLGEEIGGALLPYVERFANFASDKLIPAARQLFGILFEGDFKGGGPLSEDSGIVDTLFRLRDGFITVVDGVKLFIGALTGTGNPTGMVSGRMALVVKVAAMVRNAFVAVAGFVREHVIPRLQQLGQFITGTVIPNFLAIVATVRRFYATVIPIIQAFMAGMMARIRPLMPQIRAIFTTIGQIITGVMGLIRAVIQRVTTIIVAIWSRWGKQIMDFAAKMFGAALNIISGILRVIAGVIKTVTSVIRGDWAGAWAGVKQIFAGAWQAIKGMASAALTALSGIIRGGGTLLKGAAEWLGNKINEGLSNLASNMADKGRELVQRLIDGILGKIQAVKDAAGRVAQAIKDFFPSSPVKTGPLTAWNNGGAGRRLGSMLAGGLDSSRSAVAAASRGLASAVATPTGAPVGGVAAVGAGGPQVIQLVVSDRVLAEVVNGHNVSRRG